MEPKWWNSTSEATLQLNFMEAGLPSWASTSAAGPVFKVTYPEDALKSLTSSAVTSGAAAVATSAAPEFQQYVNPKPSGLPAGSLAAAIVVPVVAVLIAIGVYVRFARLKEAEKRKRWSAAVDRRMSTISQDWRSQSVHGSINPGAGGRPSMQSNRQTRASSYMGRTSSTYAVENNMAGAGAGNRTRVRPDGSAPEMRQLPAGDGARGSLFTPSERISRVSFADARTSRVSFGDALRPTMSNLSGTKHQASRSATNLTTPERLRSSILNRNSSAIDDDDVASLSPSQVAGPYPFNEKEVKGLGSKGKVGKKIARKSVGDWEGRASAEDFRNAEDVRSSVDQLREMEAVMCMSSLCHLNTRANDQSVMRRSKAMSQYSANEQPSPALTSPPIDTNQMEELALPTQPAAAMRPSSPMGMPLPSASLSPDEMLAAYAAARRNGPVGNAVESQRSPDRLSVVSNNPFRASMVSQSGKSDASYYSTDAAAKQE